MKTNGNLSASETARRLGLGLNYIYIQLWLGRFEGAHKVGRMWRIPLKAVEARRKKKIAEAERTLAI